MIVESNFSIKDLSIEGAHSDGLDSDFSDGNIFNSKFINIGGDALEVDAWSHIAMTRSGTTVKAFINGVEQGSNTDSGWVGTDLPVYIAAGRNAATGVLNDYDAKFTNVRIVNGTAVYTSDFTVPTAPLEDITNTSLLTCQDGYFRDNSSNAHAITVNGDPEIAVFTPFGERSVEFDGSDYVQSSGTVNFSTYTNVTLETWVYPTSLNGSGSSVETLMGTASGTSGYTMFYLYGDGKIGIGITGVNEFVSATGTIANNQWYHVAAVKEGSTTTIYVNGTSVASSTTGVWSNNTDNVNIARGGTSEYLTGYLSNVRIVLGTAVYTADFTPPQEPLTAITNTSLLTCQNAVFQDNSGNAHAITVNGDPQPSNNLPFGERSVYFDGSGDYLKLPSDATHAFGTGDYTIDCWIYPQNVSSASPFIFTQGPHTTSGVLWMVYGTTYGGLTLGYAGGGSGGRILTNTQPIQDAWNHIAISRSSGTTYIYLDGQQIASSTAHNGINLTQNGPELGFETSGGTFPFKGYMSNFRSIKGTALYTTDFDVPTEPLTAVSGTSLLTCQDAVFQDNSGNAHTITVNGDAKATTNIPFDAVTYGVEQYLDDAYTVSPQGGSSIFEGASGQFLKLPNTTETDLSTGDFTIECFIYYNSFVNDGKVYIDVTNSSNYAQLTFSTSTGLRFVVSTSTVAQQGNTNGWNTGQWYHVALVRNGSTFTIYRDGVSIASGTRSTSIGNFNSKCIGGSQGFASTTSDAYISNFRMVNGTALYTSDFTPPTAPLTPTIGTSLLTNFTNASILDATGRNVIETVGNAQVDTTTVKYGTGAMEFDGTGDWLLIPATEQMAMGTGDFTAECWFNATSSSARGLFHITTGHLNSQATGIGLGASTTAGNPWRVYHGTTATDTSSNLVTGSWQHIAIVRNGTAINVYLNGTSIYSATDSSDLSSYTYLTVGAWYSSAYPWLGYIDDLRITKGIARYTANFTPPTAELPVIGEV